MPIPLDDLRALALRHADGARVETAVPRLSINLGHAPTDMRMGLFEPAVCLVLQGAKETVVGEQRIRYGEGCFIVASVALPVSGRILEASREKPYVSLALSLNLGALADLLPAAPGPDEPPTSYGVSEAAPELADAWLRLAQLLDRPQDIAVLAPMLEREILYRLLQGPQGSVLRQIACAESRVSRVRRAIGWIREHFDKPLRVAHLAELSGMSPAAFHRHFKAVTAMSPLQFQKSLRLQQARQLLIAEPDAARAGYAVGYESASQFSREYARLFGAPPARDALRLRRDPAAAAATPA